MKYLVAVSGGVDSVVLLDMLVSEAQDDLIVAHFEHGIRGQESLDDQKFVRDLAKRHNIEFVTMNADLGAHVSEAEARLARYDFLRREARKRDATIVTAHHADDTIETIAINLARGTGWRGLAVLSSDIYRPLLHMTKAEIIDYAQTHGLKWREDSTNQTDAYLRNRLRRKLTKLSSDTKLQLLALRDTQVYLKQELDAAIAKSIADGPMIERAIVMHLDDQVADEYLRALCVRLFGVSPPRPARIRMLAAIRTYTPAKLHQSSDFIDVLVKRHTFSLRRRTSTSQRVA